MENSHYSTQLLCYLPIKPSTAAKGPVVADAEVHGLISIPSGEKA